MSKNDKGRESEKGTKCYSKEARIRLEGKKPTQNNVKRVKGKVKGDE